jgi:hypothetical protein
LDHEIFTGGLRLTTGTLNPEQLLKVFNDNQPCIANLSNGRYKPSTRHVGVRYFWLRELVESGEIKLGYVATGDMVADGFTQGLEQAEHKSFLSILSMY